MMFFNYNIFFEIVNTYEHGLHGYWRGGDYADVSCIKNA